MRGKTTWLLALALAAVAAPAATADHKFGKQVRYAGIHPIPKSQGGGICYIEGPHVHVYAANKLEYRMHGDDEVFVGDPVAYGYDGPRHAYKGPHPIQVDAYVGGPADTEYCYLEGPHYHAFEPTGPDFQVVGGAAFYVGTPAPVFVQARPQYVAINAEYRPLVYTRPVVEVEAPVGWIGARAEFVTPGVAVVAPAPVVVGRGAVVAPGVAVGVGVGVVLPPPPTISVGIGVGIGGGVVVGGRPAPVIIEGGHHDNGWHNGWGGGKHRGR